MLMNRTFFLACATALTLGIAAATSTPAHARPCSKADSNREECLIRSVIYNAQAAASEAATEAAKLQSSRGGSTAKSKGDSKPTKPTMPTAGTRPNAASSPATCGLTKEYVNGAVKFRDTCTGEWAQRDTM